MKISQAFPSNYLKVADLRGRRHSVEIKEVPFEEVGEDKKLVCYFKDKSKGLVLNKTNASTIAEITGSDDTDDWPGTTIVLRPTKVDFQGKRVDAIRIDCPDVKPPLPSAHGDDDTQGVDDDDIPF